MDTHENIRPNDPEEIVDLGAASVETKGIPFVGDEGQGYTPGIGITD